MTVAFGHGISVSPLQMGTAVSAVVNGGVLHRATLIKHIQGMFGIWKRTHEAWDGMGSPIIDGHDMLPVYRRAPMMPLKA